MMCIPGDFIINERLKANYVLYCVVASHPYFSIPLIVKYPDFHPDFLLYTSEVIYFMF